MCCGTLRKWMATNGRRANELRALRWRRTGTVAVRKLEDFIPHELRVIANRVRAAVRWARRCVWKPQARDLIHVCPGRPRTQASTSQPAAVSADCRWAKAQF